MVACCLVLLAVTPMAAGAQTAGPPYAAPEDPVVRLNDALLAMMRAAGGTTLEQRKDRILPVLRDVYAFDRMGQYAVGRSAFTDLSPDQRRRYLEQFALMSAVTYASRFDGYSGEQFAITGRGEGRGGTEVVKTALTTGGGETIDLHYLVREVGDQGWQIVDVLLQGRISELSRRRAEFGALYQREGYDGLIRGIEETINRLRTS